MANQKPYISMEDYEGKPVAGTFVSREKAGRHLANLVLERAGGQRFRAVVVSSELDDALIVGGWKDPNG